MTVIVYQLFSWDPPELSAPQRIELGRAIAGVGSEAFVKALKKRLTAPAGSQAPFTLDDVLSDAEAPTVISLEQKLVSGALLAAAFAGVVLLGGLGTLFVACAV